MALADGVKMENKTIITRNRVITSLIALVVAMLIVIVVLSFFIPEPTETAKPNIIFILADDLGWNDVGFHGSNQIPTPNIDALAYSGIILNDYYVSPLCTPSRSALLTGKHPIHTGMQHQVIYGFEPYGLGLSERLLPEYLKDEGYSTHLVGKWHLGHFRKEYTPTYRGFDTHFGFWSGHQDYYDHYAEENPAFWGFDMRRDMNVSKDTIGQYTTTLLDNESVKLIKQHDTSKPMFLMVAHAAPHAGNPSIPLQAPDDVVKIFDNEFIPDQRRQKYAAMVWLLDQSIGNLVQALSDKKMLANSIIIFSSDNGGAGGGYNFNVASNWPLRGGKDTTWEGGVKAAALIWSPLIKQSRAVFNNICSIQDWLPTLLSAIKSKVKPKGLDGENIWPALNDPSRKTYSKVLLQIDDIRNISAIREDEFKLLIGTTWGGIYDKSLGAEGRKGEYNVTLIKESKSAGCIRETKRNLPEPAVMTQLRTLATVTCAKEVEEQLCYPVKGEECLFNLLLDPCESINLASEFPEVVDKLKKKLEKYRKSAVPPRNAKADPLSNPKFWDYEWTNWRDYPDPPHSESQLVMPNTLGMDII